MAGLTWVGTLGAATGTLGTGASAVADLDRFSTLGTASGTIGAGLGAAVGLAAAAFVCDLVLGADSTATSGDGVEDWGSATVAVGGMREPAFIALRSLSDWTMSVSLCRSFMLSLLRVARELARDWTVEASLEAASMIASAWVTAGLVIRLEASAAVSLSRLVRVFFIRNICVR